MIFESTGDWMIEYELELRIKSRIACEELGYPQSEALFDNTQQWEEFHNRKWMDYVVETM